MELNLRLNFKILHLIINTIKHDNQNHLDILIQNIQNRRSHFMDHLVIKININYIIFKFLNIK